MSLKSQTVDIGNHRLYKGYNISVLAETFLLLMVTIARGLVAGFY
jgi:hypothetical protein